MGKLLLLAACLGCFAPALTIASCLSHRSPFLSDPSHLDAVGRSRAGLAAAGTSPPSPYCRSDNEIVRNILGISHLCMHAIVSCAASPATLFTTTEVLPRLTSWCMRE